MEKKEYNVHLHKISPTSTSHDKLLYAFWYRLMNMHRINEIKTPSFEVLLFV